MNPTRRSLCGLGIASVPLAMLGPRVYSAEQGTTETRDSFLAYLVEDTKRNCRLASVPGRERAHAFRRLGANAEVLTAYVLSRPGVAAVKDAVGQRVRREGIDAVAHKVRERWPEYAAGLSREYGVAFPADLDYPTVIKAIENVQRYGCPRLGGVRGWFEREADQIDRLEGRGAATVLARQTPGNDFGPDGWSAGLGDNEGVSCYKLGVTLAAMYLVTEILPDLNLGTVLAILGVVYAVACNPWTP